MSLPALIVCDCVILCDFVYIHTLKESIARLFLALCFMWEFIADSFGHRLKMTLDQIFWTRKAAKQRSRKVLVKDFLIWALCTNQKEKSGLVTLQGIKRLSEVLSEVCGQEVDYDCNPMQLCIHAATLKFNTRSAVGFI